MTDIKKGLSAGGEGLLLVGLTIALYLLALLNFPVFSDAHGILMFMEREGTFPVTSQGLIAASAVFFVLAGALLAHWAPAINFSTLSRIWAAMYLFFWVDPVVGLAVGQKSLFPVISVLLGLLFVALFFKLLGVLRTTEAGSSLVPTWRSRWAGFWLVTWMGFLLGLSSVLVSEWSPPFLHRLTLGGSALLMAALFYFLAEHLRRSEGNETVGLAIAWKWMLATWAVLIVVNVLVRRFLETL